MSRGTQWDSLEFNGSDEYYEAMLPDFQSLETWGEDEQDDVKDQNEEDEWRGWDLNLKERTQQLINDLMSMYGSKVEQVYNMGWKLHDLRGVTSCNFEETVEESLPFSYSTACNYMNVALRFNSAADAALFDSKVMYAMATKSFPERVRRNMISRAKEGNTVTLKEVCDARDQVRREAACWAGEDSGPIEFEKTPYMELLERIRASLEDITAEVEEFPLPEELSKIERFRKADVWILLDELVKIFDPDD